KIGSLIINPLYLDGNCLFTQFSDNLLYGVMDAPFESPSVFYTEIEYMHRFKFFTRRPAVVDCDREFYLHHFRNDPNVQNIRNERYHRREKAGRNFWFQKFGIADVVFDSDEVANELYEKTIMPEISNKFKQHLIFGGLWNNWKDIYDRYSKYFQVFGENCFYKIRGANFDVGKLLNNKLFVSVGAESKENILEKLYRLGLWSEEKSLRLHLGCGENYLESYVNIDFPPEKHTVMRVKADIYQDITRLQFPSESVDEVRLHHVFEHFDRVTALALLIKWSEWLKIGGKLHIETPDIEGCAKIIVSNAPFNQKQAIIRHLFGSHEASWAYHLDGWSVEKFNTILTKFGFEVSSRTWHWQRYPYLPNVEVLAKKINNFSRQELLGKAKEILYDYIVDNKAESELKMFNIWVKNLTDFLNDSTYGKEETSQMNFTEQSKEIYQHCNNKINIILEQENYRDAGFNDDNPETNGEYLSVISLIKNGDTVFDIGANQGNWSKFLLKQKENVKLYLFEPIPDLLFNLVTQFKDFKNIKIYPFALSDKEEIVNFYYYKQIPSLSTLHRRDFEVEKKLALVPETFKTYTKTLDVFVKEVNVEHINYMKIDTEGSECHIIRGAEGLLRNQKIDFLQFEYGGTYMASNSKLKQIFLILSKHQYRLFRIIPNGLVHISFWEDRLENYQYSNYLAIRNEISKILLLH
ncbi:MAG: class I SAM-dependent methyltransferase, partial [Candidatus Kapaibacteriota bacterium]